MYYFFQGHVEAILKRWTVDLNSQQHKTRSNADFSARKISLNESILIFVWMGFALVVTALALCLELLNRGVDRYMKNMKRKKCELQLLNMT